MGCWNETLHSFATLISARASPVDISLLLRTVRFYKLLHNLVTDGGVEAEPGRLPPFHAELYAGWGDFVFGGVGRDRGGLLDRVELDPSTTKRLVGVGLSGFFDPGAVVQGTLF